MRRWIARIALALFGFAGLAICLTGYVLWWNLPIEPSVVVPVSEGVHGMKSQGRWVHFWRNNSAPGMSDELVDSLTGKRIALDRDHRRQAAFSPDGKFFVALSGGQWLLWNLETNAPPMVLCDNLCERVNIFLSRDSRYVAATSDADLRDRYLEIWELATAAPVASLSATDFYGAMGKYCLNADWGCDRKFFAERNHTERGLKGDESVTESVCCWDGQTSRVHFEIENPANGGFLRPTWRVSPDGRRCVAIVTRKASDRKWVPNPFADNQSLQVPIEPQLQMWDVAAGKVLWEKPLPGEHAWFDLSFAGHGRTVAISSRDLAQDNAATVQVRDVETGAERLAFAEKSTGYWGSFFLSDSGRFLQYRTPPWVNAAWPRGEKPTIAGGWWEIRDNVPHPSILFDDDSTWRDPDGVRHVVFSEAEMTAKKFSAERRAFLEQRPGDEGVGAPGVLANLSPDERWLAIRRTFQSMKHVKAAFGHTHGFPVSSHELRLRDLNDGSEGPALPGVEHWAFSPDGKTLVTVGAGELRRYEIPLAVATWQRWLLLGCAAGFLGLLAAMVVIRLEASRSS
jgi:hypothetical protein